MPSGERTPRRVDRRQPALVVLLALAIACGSGADDGAALDADGPVADDLLPTPFTAEQIRDAFRPGLEIRFYSKAGDRPRELSSMRVLEADDTGARIEQAPLDDDGLVAGERRVTRSAWTELRDHASFPAATTARAALRRPTPLGELDGWLYTVRDREKGTVTEFFFAGDLPGPPVTLVVRSTAERAVLREYLQVARNDLAAGAPAQ